MIAGINVDWALVAFATPGNADLRPTRTGLGRPKPAKGSSRGVFSWGEILSVPLNLLEKRTWFGLCALRLFGANGFAANASA